MTKESCPIGCLRARPRYLEIRQRSGLPSRELREGYKSIALFMPENMETSIRFVLLLKKAINMIKSHVAKRENISNEIISFSGESLLIYRFERNCLKMRKENVARV